MDKLTPVDALPPQAWLKDESTQKIMAALNQGEGAPQALFVGGCVRNAILGQAVKDIDIATIHTPDKATELLKSTGFKTIPTGIEHGTITAIIDGHPFEVTTLRQDIQTDGRHATVSWTQDWTQDAQRRDFTMNTLLADEKGNIYDPLACGIADLKAHRVIFVGNPDARIAEDHLRILRFFRFHAIYGAGEPDKAALNACTAATGQIEKLSKERITQEIFKLLMAPNPAPVLSYMNEYKIISFKAYKAAPMDKLCRLQAAHKQENLPARLLILAGLEPEQIKTMNETLLIPKKTKREMEKILKACAFPALDNDHAIKVALYKQGRPATAQAFFVKLSTNQIQDIKIEKSLELIQNWPIPKCPVNGHDLISQGYQGAELGSKLAQLEGDWITAGFI